MTTSLVFLQALLQHQCNNDSTTSMRGHPVATMETRTTLERVRALFSKDAEQDYAPLSDSVTLQGDAFRRQTEDSDGEVEHTKADDGEPFSWFEYSIFLMLGIAMLWAWYVTSTPTDPSPTDLCIGTCS